MIGRVVPSAAILVSTLLLIATGGFAQTPTPQNPKYPTQVDANYLNTHTLPHPKYLALDLLSPNTKTALNREAEAVLSGNANAIGAASTIVSIPRWPGSFAFDGPVQPFIMAGNFPHFTSTTFIKTQLVPISLVFDGFINPMTGTTAVINTGPSVVAKTLAGPDFAVAHYTDGFTQFADAVQRAEFQSVRRTDWHTILTPPTMFAGVTIHVPSTAVQVFQLQDGKIFCKLDFTFFFNQLNALLQSEPLTPRQLRIFLIKNTFLIQNGDPNFLVVGFHTEAEATTSTQTFIQTLAYASWIDSDVAAGALANPNFTDIAALSHEISEWMNDPFVNNAVTPKWQFPGQPGVCQGNLEVGDPVEVLAPNLVNFPVTIGGFTYHPQNEALLQWFAQVSPSNAIDGAYSYPNEGSLTSASISCP
jgi:hypothetical protein